MGKHTKNAKHIDLNARDPNQEPLNHIEQEELKTHLPGEPVHHPLPTDKSPLDSVILIKGDSRGFDGGACGHYSSPKPLTPRRGASREKKTKPSPYSRTSPRPGVITRSRSREVGLQFSTTGAEAEEELEHYEHNHSSPGIGDKIKRGWKSFTGKVEGLLEERLQHPHSKHK